VGTAFLACVLSLAQASCVQKDFVLRSSSGRVTPSERASIGIPEVEIDASRLELRLDGVHRGVLDGLAIGCVRGVTALILFPLAGAGIGIFVVPPAGVIVGGMLGGAAAGLYFPFSLLNGMATAVPPDSCDAAQEEIRKAVLEAPWRDSLKGTLTQALVGPVPRNSSVTTSSEAVVQVLLLEAGSSGSWLRWPSLWTIDAPVALFIEGEARLLRQKDRRLLGAISFRYCAADQEKLIVAWGANGGAAARAAFRSAAEQVAYGIVAEWFPAPVAEAEAPSERRPSEGRRDEK
jgi:hypothetical protein